MTVKNEEIALDSLHLIVENSNYQPEYLKRLYIIEYYRTLQRVEKTIKSRERKK